MHSWNGFRNCDLGHGREAKNELVFSNYLCILYSAVSPTEVNIFGYRNLYRCISKAQSFNRDIFCTTAFRKRSLSVRRYNDKIYFYSSVPRNLPDPVLSGHADPSSRPQNQREES